jgi:hypothetical protein
METDGLGRCNFFGPYGGAQKNCGDLNNELNYLFHDYPPGRPFLC